MGADLPNYASPHRDERCADRRERHALLCGPFARLRCRCSPPRPCSTTYDGCGPFDTTSVAIWTSDKYRVVNHINPPHLRATDIPCAAGGQGAAAGAVRRFAHLVDKLEAGFVVDHSFHESYHEWWQSSEGADWKSWFFSAASGSVYSDDATVTSENVTRLAAALEAQPDAASGVQRLSFAERDQVSDVALAKLITALGNAPSGSALRELAAPKSSFGDKSMAALASTLAGFKMLEQLVLYNSKVGDEGITALTAALTPASLPALRTLSLFGNTAITDASITLLATAIASGPPFSLSSLRAPQFGGRGAGPSMDTEHKGPLGLAFEKRPGGMGLLTEAANKIRPRRSGGEQIEFSLTLSAAPDPPPDARPDAASDAAPDPLQSSVQGPGHSYNALQSMAGASFREWRGELVVASIVEGGAAATAGLRAYDEIISVDGVEFAALNGTEKSEPPILLKLSVGIPPGTVLQLCAYQRPVIEQMRNNQVTLTGAHRVLERLKGGSTIEFASGQWGFRLTNGINEAERWCTCPRPSTAGRGSASLAASATSLSQISGSTDSRRTGMPPRSRAGCSEQPQSWQMAETNASTPQETLHRSLEDLSHCTHSLYRLPG